MSQKSFKLLVQVSARCIDILKYVDKNIGNINRLGIRLHIEKISKEDLDDELVHKLRAKGITRLPAMIDSNGKVYIGIGKIREVFESGMDSVRKTTIGAPVGYPAGGSELGTNSDMQEFWARELYQGFENGKFIPRKDNEANDDDRNDIEDRMRRYQTNVPKHRQDQNNPEFDQQMEQRQTTRQRNFDANNANNYEDNIADDPPRMPSQTRGGMTPSASFQPTGDALDDKMMAAWLDKNSDES